MATRRNPRRRRKCRRKDRTEHRRRWDPLLSIARPPAKKPGCCRQRRALLSRTVQGFAVALGQRLLCWEDFRIPRRPETQPRESPQQEIRQENEACPISTLCPAALTGPKDLAQPVCSSRSRYPRPACPLQPQRRAPQRYRLHLDSTSERSPIPIRCNSAPRKSPDGICRLHPSAPDSRAVQPPLRHLQRPSRQ